MSDILQKILATKRREVEAARIAVPLPELERRARAAQSPRGFTAALQARIAAGKPAVIAEIKRASPSRGLIRADFDPARIAISYAANGAACLSVLTDREYFGGSREDLEAARAACALPVIRKDFIIDAYQVIESRAWGADCILLIVDAVSDSSLDQLEALAISLGMDVLVESHDAGQLERAIRLRTPLLGVNNRDLRNFEIRLETSLELANRIPAGKILVAESGIASPADVERLRNGKVSAYLVGSAFMAAADPGAELSRLFSGL
ncbi:MAG TPA: indole-3-glycerol phosphate synthase TrpC [Usitatibacteraceae bacterium]|nr:indole-3-glycerol phosphate synthase TrpC [Usitatibacteraceae bacterium]